ncbi:hypothetical protein M4951_04160 [Blastopirellula sp. J2-11]|uniref:hypothetical protein n=1 Tax=Blastopirellula sp. J2-11 TaxID=2943192 RepID=UPI0021C6A4BF|nr:hypothetical protein [Blastopirellula sp. J2-11]UUO07505.1 hypothetical protein M4951_04160 [Blastopirellula sp. J2-11]
MKQVTIRFAGNADDTTYFLKLGPMLQYSREREFHGGDEIVVQMQPTPEKTDCFDLTFADGQFAIEVPGEMFAIIREHSE